jgi:putative SOS response-associated peptidase YedK
MCYSAMLRRDIKALEKRFGPLTVRSDEAAWYETLHARNPKLFPEVAQRIFQGRFARVVHFDAHGCLVASHMRYGAFPPAGVRADANLTTFNARRDNLRSPFWSSSYGKGHGVVLLEGFFEWVTVKDLLAAGRVTLAEVETEFERQREDRRARVEAAGKLYRPTKTELTDARFRKTVIQFRPLGRTEGLVAPVIFNTGDLGGERVSAFALVTDDPPDEVRAAGHDRCPVFLSEQAWPAWLVPKGKTPKELDALLGGAFGKGRSEPLVHELDSTRDAA